MFGGHLRWCVICNLYFGFLFGAEASERQVAIGIVRPEGDLAGRECASEPVGRMGQRIEWQFICCDEIGLSCVRFYCR